MARSLITGLSTSGGTVTVYWFGTTTKPVIYDGAAGSAKANPITAAGDGFYAFWINNGHYTVVNGTPTGNREVTVADQVEGWPRAAEVSMTPYLGNTSTTVQGWIEGMLATPSFPGDATFSGQVSVTGKTNIFSDLVKISANAASLQFFELSEEVTLSTGGTTTDSSANLLPANSFIMGVVARVTTTITTATDWKLGDPTTAGRFTAANATMVAGTTDVGLIHLSGASTTLAAGPSQVSAAKIRITTTGTPGAGKIRVTTFGWTLVPPTS